MWGSLAGVRNDSKLVSYLGRQWIINLEENPIRQRPTTVTFQTYIFSSTCKVHTSAGGSLLIRLLLSSATTSPSPPPASVLVMLSLLVSPAMSSLLLSSLVFSPPWTVGQDQSLPVLISLKQQTKQYMIGLYNLEALHYLSFLCVLSSVCKVVTGGGEVTSSASNALLTPLLSWSRIGMDCFLFNADFSSWFSSDLCSTIWKCLMIIRRSFWLTAATWTSFTASTTSSISLASSAISRSSSTSSAVWITISLSFLGVNGVGSYARR